MPSVVVYLTFTLMYDGIISPYFITCKLQLEQSRQGPQPVLQIIPEKLWSWEANKIFTIYNLRRARQGKFQSYL